MAATSVLCGIQQSLGASFTEFESSLIPDSYGDARSEWAFVRESVGLFDLPYRTIFEMSGNDSSRFLQGMVSNDVEKLREGHGTYAVILTIQGKVVSDLRIYRTDRSFLIETSEPARPKVIEHLDLYLIADEVEIRALQDHALLSLQGPRSAHVLEDLGLPVPEAECQHRRSALKDGTTHHPTVCLRVSLTGEVGFLILVNTDDLKPMWNRLLGSVRRSGGGPVGFQALQSLRMEAGIPWFGVDFDSTNFPLEAGLDRIVSQSKGCYLGQEVMERIRARGHVNRLLVALSLDGSALPSRGARVYHEERDIGEITSAAFSFGSQSGIAFAIMNRERALLGESVSIRAGARTQHAVISSLPGIASC